MELEKRDIEILASARAKESSLLTKALLIIGFPLLTFGGILDVYFRGATEAPGEIDIYFSAMFFVGVICLVLYYIRYHKAKKRIIDAYSGTGQLPSWPAGDKKR